MPTALLCRGVAIGEPRECVLGAVFSLLHFVGYDVITTNDKLSEGACVYVCVWVGGRVGGCGCGEWRNLTCK